MTESLPGPEPLNLDTSVEVSGPERLAPDSAASMADSRAARVPSCKPKSQATSFPSSPLMQQEQQR